MSRDYARYNVTIWQDPDFRALPYPAQALYSMLWTHPELSYCGVVDWRPAKLTGWGAGWTKTDICTLAACLEARHFIVIDEDTEEVLVRSWVRWDGLMRQPRLAVSFANAYAAVGSNLIRGVVIHEMNKLRKLEPDALGWGKPQVKAMSGSPSVDPKDRDVAADPFAEGFTITFGSVSSEVSSKGSPGVSPEVPQEVGVNLGSISNAPTPSPAPTPLLLSASAASTDAPVKAPAQKRGQRIPDDFQVTPEMVTWAQSNTPGINGKLETEKFIDHWRAKTGRDATKLDWVGTWRNWMRNATSRPVDIRSGPSSTRPNRAGYTMQEPPRDIVDDPAAVSEFHRRNLEAWEKAHA